MPKASKAGTAVQKPTIRIKPSSYQPSKAELEKDMSVKATPRQLAAAALATVDVQEEDS